MPNRREVPRGVQGHDPGDQRDPGMSSKNVFFDGRHCEGADMASTASFSLEQILKYYVAFLGARPHSIIS